MLQHNRMAIVMPLVVSASIVLLRICDILSEGMGRRGAWCRHLTTQNLARLSSPTTIFTGMNGELEENIVGLLFVLHSRSLLLEESPAFKGGRVFRCNA